MSEPSVRAFVAIDLPPAVKQVLGRLQTSLRGQTNAARWASPEGTHLTLKFLGSVAVEQVPEINARLARVAAQHRPFELRTGKLGVFPDPRRPRVVWLGVEGELAVLERLQSAVEQAIAPLGYPAEARPFNPHLTLGRSVKQPSAAQLAALAAAVAQTPALTPVAFTVHELILMHSELLPSGARYTALSSARLDGAT